MLLGALSAKTMPTLKFERAELGLSISINLVGETYATILINCSFPFLAHNFGSSDFILITE